MTPEEIAQFKEWNVPLPTRESHGSDSYDNPASSRLVKAQPTNWRLVGNELTADTQFGKLVRIIPSDYIMTGVGKDNLPILKKIGC